MNSSTFPTLVFVDATVDRYEQLVSTVQPQTKVVVLQPDQDGIQQITQILREVDNVESLHLVTHGYAGGLRLGASVLETATLDQHATELADWSNAFAAQPQVLLYGCDVAAGEVGQAFVQRLSQLTQANVAASSHLIGSPALGGDWSLDYAIGTVTAPLAFSAEALAAYDSVLAALPGTSTAASPNLVTNGNFAAGNTGFTTTLPYRGANTYPNDAAGGGYTISNVPQQVTFLPGVVVGKPFSGDPNRGVPASNSYLYSNPNWKTGSTVDGSAFPDPLIWQQTIAVKPNTTYSFLVYVDNLLEPTVPGVDPLMDLRVNGTSLGTPISVGESPNDWVPVEYTFTTSANQTTAEISIIDQANDLGGDDFGLTAISVREAVPIKISIGTTTGGSNTGTLTGNESAGSLSIPITLDAAPDTAFTLNYSFTAPNDTATNNQDYRGTNGSVSIAPGQRTAVITVPIINDSVREGDEKFTLDFWVPQGNRANLLTPKVVTTIRDDETGGGTPTPPPPVDPGNPADPSDGCKGRGVTRSGSGSNNRLNGSSGADVLRGLAGNDQLRGGTCNDRLFGGAGNDQLIGDIGRDTLNGGTGSDRLNGGRGRDTLGGGAGDDRMRGGTENDFLRGGTGRDRLNGDAGDDFVNGGAQNDIVVGGLGNDLVIGAAGTDRLFGGADNDVLIGALGADKLNGGGGSDRFVYRRANEGRDRVDRFEVAQDVIDLRLLFRGTPLANASATDRFSQGIRLRPAAGGSTTVFADTNGAAAGGLVNVATINGIAPASLTATNFLLA